MIDYDSLVNRTVRQIKPSGIRKFFDIANEMDDVISLSVGEPDFHTPWHIREAGIESLEKGRTSYTPNRGFLKLRAEISNYLERHYNVKYDPQSEVLVTVGGSEAIDLCVRTLIEPGDEVLIPEPSFVCYVPITEMAGGVPVIIETKPENKFRLTAEELEEKITDKTKLLIMPYPNNPTGAVMRRSDLEAVAQVVERHNLMVLSDEIYASLTYGEEKPHRLFGHSRHAGAHHFGQRVFQVPLHDGLAHGLRRGPQRDYLPDDEAAPVRHYERPHHEPVRRH